MNEKEYYQLIREVFLKKSPDTEENILEDMVNSLMNLLPKDTPQMIRTEKDKEEFREVLHSAIYVMNQQTDGGLETFSKQVKKNTRR